MPAGQEPDLQQACRALGGTLKNVRQQIVRRLSRTEHSTRGYRPAPAGLMQQITRVRVLSDEESAADDLA